MINCTYADTQTLVDSKNGYETDSFLSDISRDFDLEPIDCHTEKPTTATSWFTTITHQITQNSTFPENWNSKILENADELVAKGSFSGIFSNLVEYVQRITELHQIAKDEEIQINQDSESDFWKYVDFDYRMREGDILLMDNGNLRLVWNDQQGTHLGLQFLGNQHVQYVIFKQRKPCSPVSRVTGRDTFDGVRKQIKSFELDSLIYP